MYKQISLHQKGHVVILSVLCGMGIIVLSLILFAFNILVTCMSNFIFNLNIILNDIELYCIYNLFELIKSKYIT